MRPREGIEVHAMTFCLAGPTSPDVRNRCTIKYSAKGESNTRRYNDTHGDVANSLEHLAWKDSQIE